MATEATPGIRPTPFVLHDERHLYLFKSRRIRASSHEDNPFTKHSAVDPSHDHISSQPRHGHERMDCCSIRMEGISSGPVLPTPEVDRPRTAYTMDHRPYLTSTTKGAQENIYHRTLHAKKFKVDISQITRLILPSRPQLKSSAQGFCSYSKHDRFERSLQLIAVALPGHNHPCSLQIENIFVLTMRLS